MKIDVNSLLRRVFLCAVTFIATAALPNNTAFAATKPDILLIMPDQWRGDYLSSIGHPVVRTPNLDRLAADGTLFRRAYTTIPSCIPARYALLTGQFPQTSGIVGFRSRPITVPTLPQLLADAGYAAILVGREMHQIPNRELYGYQRRITGSTYINDDDYDTDLKKQAPDSGGIRNIINSAGVTTNGWEASPWPLADELHPTAWVVRQSRKIIADSPADRPLFLTASFYAPHPPLFPPKRLFDAYMKMDLPPAARGDWVDWAALPAAKPKSQAHRVRLEGQDLRRAQAGYFGLIEHLDQEIAPLIQEFKARSEKAGRPWLILFTTDHGEMLGDHGFFRKCEPYEGSASIPFIIAGAKELGFVLGARSQQPVCLEDILPTLVELAGAKAPEGIDGRSLIGLLRGEKVEVRPWLHFEHAPCYSKEQAFHALTDGHLKYIWRPLDGSEQLFDLDKDPREEHDLAKAKGQKDALQRWRATLIKRLAGRPEGFTDGTKLIPGRPYPPIHDPAR